MQKKKISAKQILTKLIENAVDVKLKSLNEDRQIIFNIDTPKVRKIDIESLFNKVNQSLNNKIIKITGTYGVGLNGIPDINIHIEIKDKNQGIPNVYKLLVEPKDDNNVYIQLLSPTNKIKYKNIYKITDTSINFLSSNFLTRLFQNYLKNTTL